MPESMSEDYLIGGMVSLASPLPILMCGEYVTVSRCLIFTQTQVLLGPLCHVQLILMPQQVHIIYITMYIRNKNTAWIFGTMLVRGGNIGLIILLLGFLRSGRLLSLFVTFQKKKYRYKGVCVCVCVCVCLCVSVQYQKNRLLIMVERMQLFHHNWDNQLYTIAQ